MNRFQMHEEAPQSPLYLQPRKYEKFVKKKEGFTKKHRFN